MVVVEVEAEALAEPQEQELQELQELQEQQGGARATQRLVQRRQRVYTFGCNGFGQLGLGHTR